MLKTVLLIVGIILIFAGFAVDVRGASNAGPKWAVKIVAIVFGIIFVVLSLMIFDGMITLPEQFY
ncbi:MAG: hypothetical protein K6G84_06500 [Lachnospiraceae bacterium]|nr:hypothetical protein [Lachnospiraceae bacterium]